MFLKKKSFDMPRSRINLFTTNLSENRKTQGITGWKCVESIVTETETLAETSS